VLCFNLLFDKDNKESDDTGFFFVDQNAALPDHTIKMTELSGIHCDPKEQTLLEKRYTKNVSDEQELVIKTNLKGLWDVFVDRGVKSIAYFSVVTNSETEVNEVFRRLNTGGIMLTQLEMVLAKIKAQYPDYEEKLWEIAKDIETVTFGYHFSSADVLQFFYFLVLGTTRAAEARVDNTHVAEFHKHLTSSRSALREFFEHYVWGQFRINHATIIPRGLARFPIPVYLAARKEAGYSFEIKRLSSENLKAINQYFIFSQFGDWNTHTMVNAFCEQALNAGYAGEDFPLDAIRTIAVNKNRTDTLYYHQFLSQPWLAHKILTPHRAYIFYDETPQVDHIFPLALPNTDDNYRARVDVLWNFQSMPAGVNNYKRARHPKEFFTSSDSAKYLKDYDFLPDLKSNWGNEARRFIWHRHKQMRSFLLTRYGLTLKRLRPSNVT